MAFDAYSVCPGGTGKKVKFCCPDLVPELEKIDRMFEGEQYQAALQHIDRLSQQGRPRECLMALKGSLLRGLQRLEEAEAHAAEFLRVFPQNPIAWAESAILTTATEGGRAAMPKLQRALSLSTNELDPRVYTAIDALVHSLIEEGDWIAARALLHLQLAMMPDDSHAMEDLLRVNRSNEIPLLLKQDPPLLPPPEDAPWRPRAVAALALVQRARWQDAAEGFAALAQENPQVSSLWQNLAILRAWLTDDQGATEAWQRFAALEVPFEDAVEAQTTAMLLSPEPLGDGVDRLRVEWPVSDAERLHEALLSDRRILSMPFDPAQMSSEDSPPPRMVFMVLDRPMPESAEGLTLASIPRVLAQAALFGRQTDREARLEAHGVLATELDAMKTVLREVGGDALAGEPTQETVGRSSASGTLLSRRWNAPRGTSQEQIRKLSEEHFRAVLLEQWPELSLGVFDGRSARQVEADPAYRVRLAAAILLLEDWHKQTQTAFDFNQLRESLGLPPLGPIEVAPGTIDGIPLVRLERVVVEKLTDDDLVAGCQRAATFRALAALRKFAREIVARPSMAEGPERAQAYTMLTQAAESLDEALGYVAEGRRMSEAAGQSCANWDLMELSFRFLQGNAAEAMRLMRHVESHHMEEPGVAQALTRLLVEVGVLNPDGSPAIAPGMRPETAPAAPTPDGGGSGLWTPGGQTGGSTGGGKIWTPE